MNVEKMYDELQGEICNLKRKLAEGGAVHIVGYPAYGNRYFVVDAAADDSDATLVIGSYNETIYLKIFKIFGIKY